MASIENFEMDALGRHRSEAEVVIYACLDPSLSALPGHLSLISNFNQSRTARNSVLIYFI